MNALAFSQVEERSANEVARVALIGTGTVGRAVLNRLCEWQGQPIGQRLRLVYVGNTRTDRWDAAGLCPRASAAIAYAARNDTRPDPKDVMAALGDSGIRIVVDATANADVAQRHPQYLAAGIHVATACKLAGGTSRDLWDAVQKASDIGRTGFGDRATVGAGLPLIRSIRDLRAGGDQVHAIAGVMSGSLAWLFDQFDGTRPFSDLVREAGVKGYTEPDPREDLSGEDVRRKILILARASGAEIDSNEVIVESLVPLALAALPPDEVAANLHILDGPLKERLAAAEDIGARLRFVARFEDGRCRVSLEALPADDPLNGGRGTDNRVAIWSDRYRDQPLVIQGPGAGAEVTAAALLDDVLALRARAIVTL
nr:hypothetical protein [uncultured Sphingomonas sp.]